MCMRSSSVGTRVRGRVLQTASERVGFTGNYPVIDETPLTDESLEKDEDAKD